MYFDKIVFPDIKNEQSFLPPSLQLDSVKWKESTITNSTLVNVNDKIKNIDSELNGNFAWDWFSSGNIKFDLI